MRPSLAFLPFAGPVEALIHTAPPTHTTPEQRFRTRHWTQTGWSPCIRDAEFESQPDADKVNLHPCVLRILTSLGQGSRAASHKPSRRCLTAQPPATQPSFSAAPVCASGNPQLASTSIFPEYIGTEHPSTTLGILCLSARLTRGKWEMGDDRHHQAAPPFRHDSEGLPVSEPSPTVGR